MHWSLTELVAPNYLVGHCEYPRRASANILCAVFGFTGTTIALIGECITVAQFQKDGERKVAAAAVFFLFFHIAWYALISSGIQTFRR